MYTLPSNEQRKRILEEAQTIAVVGLSNRPERTSYMIAQAMQQNGYRIIPVNPVLKEPVLGEEPYASLTDIEEPVDLVNVFRRSEYTPEIATQAVEIKAKVLWLQQGVFNEEAARIAREGGLAVVMDQCIKVDHALFIGKK
ncbi:CoA-binding protein [Numidum massiliense]|uniref:CoA-binding protein n=1 Tax=Numidum massiliense TaxID=1522315 RepID=UPI0006D53A5D|nr:CoA-binding protein [Numidum massiliense]